MFKLLVIGVMLATIAAFADFGGSAERVEKLRITERRTESQDKILASMVAMNYQAVRQFVEDWREAYPEPGPSELSELRDIEQRVLAEPASAERMTRSYKMANSPLCNGQISSWSSFGSEHKCSPGL